MRFPPIDDISDLFGITFWGIFVLMLLFGGVAIVNSALSDGKIDYCLIVYYGHESAPGAYYLWGHRPWSENKRLSVSSTFEEAAAHARELGCPIYEGHSK